jgi:hypothetical protein
MLLHAKPSASHNRQKLNTFLIGNHRAIPWVRFLFAAAAKAKREANQQED